MSRLLAKFACPLIVVCFIVSAASFAVVYPSQARAADDGNVNAWLTTPDQSNLLTRQPAISFSNHTNTTTPTIKVNDAQKYQRMTGFGASLTASSAVVLSQPNISQDQVMRSLFDPHTGIGLSYLRQPMGSSDLAPPQDASKGWVGEYTYDDMPAGQTDPTLSHFSIAQDDRYHITSLLKQALRTILFK